MVILQFATLNNQMVYIYTYTISGGHAPPTEAERFSLKLVSLELWFKNKWLVENVDGCFEI